MALNGGLRIRTMKGFSSFDVFLLFDNFQERGWTSCASSC